MAVSQYHPAPRTNQVTIFLERFHVRRGGAERSAFELACALAGQGLAVTVKALRLIDQHRGAELPFALEPVELSDSSRGQGWQGVAEALAQRMRQEREHSIVHSLLPIPAAHVYQPRGGSIAFSAQRHIASYPSPLTRRLKQWTAGWNRKRAARVAWEQRCCRESPGPVIAALSDYVAEQFRRLYGLDDSRLRTIRNGVDGTRFQDPALPRQARELRRRIDPEGRLAVFVFAAENYRLKGLAPLIAATARAHGSGQLARDVRVMVLGSQGYAGYYRLAQRLGVGERILFPGRSDEMPAVLAMADAMILPTFNDASSRVVLEAFAAGTPVITTGYNGAADFVENDRHGILLDEPDDIPTLASAISRLCEPATQQAMAEAIARDQLADRVAITRHARELCELYQSLQSA